MVLFINEGEANLLSVLRYIIKTNMRGLGKGMVDRYCVDKKVKYPRQTLTHDSLGYLLYRPYILLQDIL